MNDDHNTTPEEMLLIQQMEQIEAYMEKFNKEQNRVQAKASD